MLECFSLPKRFKFWKTELVTRFIANSISFPIVIETLLYLGILFMALNQQKWFRPADQLLAPETSLLLYAIQEPFCWIQTDNRSKQDSR